MEKILAYAELIEMNAHLREVNDCIRWLESLGNEVKTDEVKAMIQNEVKALTTYMKEEVEIKERLPKIKEILHRAKIEG